MNRVQPKHNQPYEITRNLLQFGLIKNLPFQGILKNVLNPTIRRRFFPNIHFSHKPANTLLDFFYKPIVANRKIYGPDIIS